MKTEIENCYRLNTKDLLIQGAFKSDCDVYSTWKRGDDVKMGVNLMVRIDGWRPHIVIKYKKKSSDEGENAWQSISEEIDMSRLPCNLGGNRLYFHCPRCYKRVAQLYIIWGYFICRHCAKLTYKSRNKTRGRYKCLHRAYDYEDKAENLYKGKRWQTHYNNQPTKRYRRHERYLEISELYSFKSLRYEFR